VISLERRLEEVWTVLHKKGIDKFRREKTVEKSFKMIKCLSEKLREKYRL
jgi:hypothetical protein